MHPLDFVRPKMGPLILHCLHSLEDARVNRWKISGKSLAIFRHPPPVKAANLLLHEVGFR